MRRYLTLLALLFFYYSISVVAQEKHTGLIDGKATRKTVALYNNLKLLALQGTLFGQHEALAYGVGWRGEADRSDVKEISGSHPAVHGWDLGKIGTDKSINGVPFEDVQRYIKEVYKQGGINTVSWHMDNLLSGGSSWDTTHAVADILPGGKAHPAYLKKLDLAAAFLKDCRANIFTPIPIIFRPYHEHNGDWFWWGKGY
ncbi:MAG: glycoside hydrolase family 26 protein, partial [Pontibacter sp.]|nr:glycoside hydrolase family 26 protein [Pontibacter sp.]